MTISELGYYAALAGKSSKSCPLEIKINRTRHEQWINGFEHGNEIRARRDSQPWRDGYADGLCGLSGPINNKNKTYVMGFELGVKVRGA